MITLPADSITDDQPASSASPASPASPPAGVTSRTANRVLGFLKSTTTMPDLWAKSLPLTGGLGHLVPVCELHTTDEDVIALMAAWRAAHASAFPTRFTVTIDGTRTWLRRNLLDVDDRMLFLVLDAHGRPVGHLGIADAANPEGTIEVDNVVRGDVTAAPGIMAAAMEALLAWAEEALVPTGVVLRVLAGNEHAIRFYRRLGFTVERPIPLRRHVEGDFESLTPVADGDDAAADDVFLLMRRTKEPSWRGDEMILTAGPSITPVETSYVLDAVRTGWNTHHSDYLNRFERTFADYVGTRYAIATSSCTGALHIALAASGIGPGDEVIVPEITWVATANAVRYVGATPVFADVDPDTWCISPDSVLRCITPRTRAVMPVHLYGQPASMHEVMVVAAEHGLRVVEDAAPAIGAEVRGRKVGGFGDFGAFSFQGAKLLVTGEGGMLVTNDEELYQRARSIWDQGRDPSRAFWITQDGVKYKMSNLQAALGLGQIERVEEMIAAKRRIHGWYTELLADVPHVAVQQERACTRSIMWMTNLEVLDGAPVDRDGLQQALRARNVDTRPVFPAISQYPIWGRQLTPQPTALSIGQRGLNLPSGVRIRRSQIEYVCRSIADILN